MRKNSTDLAISLLDGEEMAAAAAPARTERRTSTTEAIAASSGLFAGLFVAPSIKVGNETPTTILTNGYTAAPSTKNPGSK